MILFPAFPWAVCCGRRLPICAHAPRLRFVAHKLPLGLSVQPRRRFLPASRGTTIGSWSRAMAWYRSPVCAPGGSLCPADASITSRRCATCAAEFVAMVRGAIAVMFACIDDGPGGINGSDNRCNRRGLLILPVCATGSITMPDTRTADQNRPVRWSRSIAPELSFATALSAGAAFSMPHSSGVCSEPATAHRGRVTQESDIGEDSRSGLASSGMATHHSGTVADGTVPALRSWRAAVPRPGGVDFNARFDSDPAVVARVRVRALRRSLIILAVFLGTSLLAPGSARADDWGCQVILCLSNAGGPEQYGQCVPPVERLWAALRRGDPFPTCDSGATGAQGTSAVNVAAGPGYCREDLWYWGGPEQSELLCDARGAINVNIDGALYTRVWWDARAIGGTITEFYGTGSTAIPYDPAQSAGDLLQSQYRSAGGQGGDE